MFHPGNLFRRKEAAPELTSLHLEAPVKPVASGKADEAAATAAALAKRTEEMRGIVAKSPAMEEINHRVQALRDSGLAPAETYFLVQPNGSIVCLSHDNPKSLTLLLFSSVLLAKDYQRATGIASQIAVLRAVDLDRLAPIWKGAGVDAFVMNKCPRCQVYVPLKPEGTITTQQLELGWAVNRAVRTWRAQQLVSNFLKQHQMAERRATLELLRDHVDCEVPYVHWLIALLAGTDGDEPARLAATERLAEFGPHFDGKTDVCLDEEDTPRWVQCMAEAMLGLTMHFGVVQLPQTTMVQ